MRCDVSLKSSGSVSSASVGENLRLAGLSFLAFTASASPHTPELYPHHLKRTHTPEEDHGDETRPD